MQRKRGWRYIKGRHSPIFLNIFQLLLIMLQHLVTSIYIHSAPHHLYSALHSAKWSALFTTLCLLLPQILHVLQNMTAMPSPSAPHYLHLLILSTCFTSFHLLCMPCSTLIYWNLPHVIPIQSHSAPHYVLYVIYYIYTLYFFTSVRIVRFIPHSFTLQFIHIHLHQAQNYCNSLFIITQILSHHIPSSLPFTQTHFLLSLLLPDTASDDSH